MRAAVARQVVRGRSTVRWLSAGRLGDHFFDEAGALQRDPPHRNYFELLGVEAGVDVDGASRRLFFSARARFWRS